MKDIDRRLTYVLVALYLMVAAITFQIYGVASLEGKIDAQLYSDSLTYEAAAEGVGQEVELISVGGNYLGPILILKVLGNNRTLVNIFNISILAVAIVLSVKKFNINRLGFLALVFSSPLVFFSTYGVNKEIFIPLYVILMTIYVDTRRYKWFLFAILIAFLVRWQMVVFSTLVAVLVSRYWPFRRRRLLTLVVLVFGISLIYPVFASSIFKAIEQVSVEGGANEIGSGASGLYPLMQDIQRNYGYFVVVVPKTLQLLVGFLARITEVSPAADFWNNVVIMGQCLQNFLLVALVFFRRRMSLSNNNFYLILLYSIFFALSPVFAPRYFLPVSFWMILLVSTKTSEDMTSEHEHRSRIAS